MTDTEDEEQRTPGLGRVIHMMDQAESEFDADLEAVGLEAGKHYGRVGWDTYDCSCELHEVNNDIRLTAEQQRAIHAAGFGKVYVNHRDGWETHYSWDYRKPFEPVRGWRRRWVTDPNASTTRSVGEKAGPQNAGYYEISYWPDGWTHPSTSDWLSSGYMRIVEDPLDGGDRTDKP